MIPRPKRRTVRAIASQRRRTMTTERELMPMLRAGNTAFGLILDGSTMCDVLVTCARFIGGADVTAAVWAVSVAAVETLRACKAVESLTLILDRSQNSRKPKVMAACRAVADVHTMNGHLKTVVLQGSDSAIVLAGSANLTHSRGAENLTVDVDVEYASAMRSRLMSLIL